MVKTNIEHLFKLTPIEISTLAKSYEYYESRKRKK